MDSGEYYVLSRIWYFVMRERFYQKQQETVLDSVYFLSMQEGGAIP
jgi:hypothetical protein